MLLDLDGLMAYAARVLSARSQTAGELRQKLMRHSAGTTPNAEISASITLAAPSQNVAFRSLSFLLWYSPAR